MEEAGEAADGQRQEGEEGVRRHVGVPVPRDAQEVSRVPPTPTARHGGLVSSSMLPTDQTQVH